MEYDRDETETGDEEGVVDWETGLPSHHDLVPLSKCLIPPELASAFGITPEPCRTILDVNRASRDTLATLRSQPQPQSQPQSQSNHFDLMHFGDGSRERNGKLELDLELELEDGDDLAREDGSESRKLRRRIIESCTEDEEDSSTSLHADNNGCDDMSGIGKAKKRPRLVWTPQLHKRFVDVVAHLGIKNAVPKTIMQLMNVEGLTRENVASHLQKYRLYLKRMQGLSNEGPSSSDHLFASTPVPQSLHESSEQSKGQTNTSNVTPPPQMMSMPMIGLGHGHGQIGMPSIVPGPNYQGIESYHYNMIPHKEWSLGRFASSHHHISSNEK